MPLKNAGGFLLYSLLLYHCFRSIKSPYVEEKPAKVMKSSKFYSDIEKLSGDMRCHGNARTPSSSCMTTCPTKGKNDEKGEKISMVVLFRVSRQRETVRLQCTSDATWIVKKEGGIGAQ
ncbi:UNVERIFIED_CONTAM: hypothetical protein NCL1_08105 [Trichonephila clavipes]